MKLWNCATRTLLIYRWSFVTFILIFFISATFLINLLQLLITQKIKLENISVSILLNGQWVGLNCILIIGFFNKFTRNLVLIILENSMGKLAVFSVIQYLPYVALLHVLELHFSPLAYIYVHSISVFAILCLIYLALHFCFQFYFSKINLNSFFDSSNFFSTWIHFFTIRVYQLFALDCLHSINRRWIISTPNISSLKVVGERRAQTEQEKKAKKWKRNGELKLSAAS